MPTSSKDGKSTRSTRKGKATEHGSQDSHVLSPRVKNRVDYAVLSGHKKKDKRTASPGNGGHDTSSESVESESSASMEGSQHDHDNGGHEHDDSQVLGSDDPHSNSESEKEQSASEGDESAQETDNDECLDDKIRGSLQKTKDLRRIEEESRARVRDYENLLLETERREKRLERERRKKKETQRYREIQRETKKRLDTIADLHRQEDELRAKLSKRRSKAKSTSKPTAQSTPRTRSEYSNILQDMLLNMPCQEDDFMSMGAGFKKLAPEKIREIRNLLETTVVNEGTNALVLPGGKNKQKPRKRKEHEISTSGEDGEVSDSSDGSSKKRRGTCLKSGRVAKVDSTDIKVVVRYPHSKLNREYVNYTSFDDLPLNIFAAGEIELILRTTNETERIARLKVLLMCLYHSQFLEVGEIREQYDVVMKGIERRELFWADGLADKLDRALDRRARVLDKESKNKASVQKIKVKPESKTDSKSKTKQQDNFVYCMDYNKGLCTEGGNHLGRFAGRENVLKHHVCRKCFTEKGVKVGHPEIDDRCPIKRN